MAIGSNNTTEDSPAPAPAESAPTPGTSHSRRNAVLRAVGLIAVVVAWLAIAGVGGPAIGSLSTVQSNDQESFLPGAAESVQAANAAAAFEDSGALPAFVIFETDGGAATPELFLTCTSSTETLAAQPANPEKPALGTIG